MTRAEKISDIYKEMANKEETFWCKVLVDTQKRFGNRLESESGIEDTIIGKIRDPDDFRKFNLEDNWPSYDDWQRSNIDEEEFTCITEVIWHPVMIWDVIKRIKENREISYWEYLVKLLGQLSRPWLWRELGLSIDDQSEECIDYIYSLIQK